MKTLTYSILHLRFHFSVFLLPVFLFALAGIQHPFHTDTVVLFVILHLLVYPSSNAYNSLQDRDTGSIGGLKNPPPTPRVLGLVTLAFDGLALLWATFALGWEVAGMLAAYILASRAYSYRSVRLKRFPVIGFLLVAFLQGGLVYLVTTVTALDISLTQLSGRVLFGTLCAMLMIGAGYPLTQIYQHDQDRADGVETLSMKLGVRGTLLFSLTLFGLFTGLMLFFWWDSPPAPFLFLVFTAPTALYFLYWTSRVWVNEAQANYDNTMRMNLISTVSLNAFFITLLLIMPWNL